MNDRIRYLLNRAACAVLGHHWVSTSNGTAEVCTRIGCRGTNRGYRVVMRGDATALLETGPNATHTQGRH